MAKVEREVAIGSILASSMTPLLRPIISVTSPEISGSHVIYKIHGKDSEGKFEVLRRYRDFISIRSLLLINWPGCYIPQIPPKQMIVILTQGNLDKNFIQRRRKLLDVFVNKISLIPHLYYSKEFQDFINFEGNYQNKISDFSEKPYIKMCDDFQKAFPDTIYFNISSEDEEEIKSSLEYFKYALESFEAFEVHCKNNVEIFYVYENNMDELMTSIKDMNDFYIEYYGSKGFEISKKDHFTNPYLILLDWSRAEILDLKAIIEAINQREKFVKIRKNAFKKYESDLKAMSEFKTGKRKLSLMISPRSKEKSDAVLDPFEKELTAIDLIYKIMTSQLIHKEFVIFKQYKIHKHEVILRTFTSASIEEFDLIAKQISEIESP
jgi:sorting nexin-1/2